MGDRGTPFRPAVWAAPQLLLLLGLEAGFLQHGVDALAASTGKVVDRIASGQVPPGAAQGLALALHEAQEAEEAEERRRKAGFLTKASGTEAQPGVFSALQEAGTLPPDFWMWKTTPAPPTPPGPNPQLLWVAQTAPPLPTTGPLPEACYGCDCIYIDPTGTVAGGSFKGEYTCHGGGATVHVPNFKWAGAPVNSGVGHPLYKADGTQCLKSQSWAIHIEDLDYPYGVGQSNNRCFTHFWAVNIPGDWTEINEQLAHKTYKDLPLVTIGKNDAGTIGMLAPCPEYGVHRYRITLWALKNYLGTELDPVNPDQPFSQVLPVLQNQELAHSTFYANVKAEGYTPKTGFLQQAATWFRKHV